MACHCKVVHALWCTHEQEMISSWCQWIGGVNALLHGFSFGQYFHHLRRGRLAEGEEESLLLSLWSVGVPSPAAAVIAVAALVVVTFAAGWPRMRNGLLWAVTTLSPDATLRALGTSEGEQGPAGTSEPVLNCAGPVLNLLNLLNLRCKN